MNKGQGKDVVKVGAAEADQKATDAKALAESQARIQQLERNIAELKKLEALKSGGAESGNTYGKVTGDVAKSAPNAKAANPEVNKKNLLEKAQDKAKSAVDDWVEKQGDNKAAMAAGAITTAAIEVFMPGSYWELIPVGKVAKIAKKGAELAGIFKKGEDAIEVAQDIKKGENAADKAGDAKKAEEAGKDANKAEKEAAEKGKKKEGDGKGGQDTQVKDDGKGRCTLKPYRRGCPPPQTPHHVVPDHCFKQPGDGGYYPGTEGVTHADGLCICVGGARKSTAKDGSSIKRLKGKFLNFYRNIADHGKIHLFTDAGELALGHAGVPKGTTALGAMEKLGARVAGKVTGCNPADLEKQLRDYHQSKGLGPTTKVRADPFGSVKNLDPSQMGTGQGRGAGID